MMLVPRFSESEAAQRWLDRFSGTDGETAAAILDEVLPVSADEFKLGMTPLLERILAERKNDQPLALYAGREVEWDGDEVLSIFAKEACRSSCY